MTRAARALVILSLAAASVAVVATKERKAQPPSHGPTSTVSVTTAPAALPRLLDLGAGKCVPCKAMAPILEDLRREFAGRMVVEFIDVWQDEEAGKRHGIEMIPTQIFFSADGRELYRHTGFMGRDDILSRWKELGIDFGRP